MTYLVGYSSHGSDSGAIDLACQFALSEADTVHSVSVVPRGWATPAAGDSDREFEQWAAASGAASAAEALEHLATHPGIDSVATWVAGRSVPQELLDQAQTLDASILFVGSGDSGARGYVTATSKTGRLLRSSNVPIAIAPRGYRAEPGTRVTRVTMAFRDDDASWTLLDRVSQICRRTGSPLRLVTFAIRPRTMVTSPVRALEDVLFQQWKDQAHAGLEEAGEHLQQQGFSSDEVSFVVAEGRSWGRAFDSIDWLKGEVLVLGSSSTHRLAQVFLGSSAAKILENSTVPVVVVP